MPRPVHFEIPAAEPDRAIRFYETVFGWKFSRFPHSANPYWNISTGDGPGINGGLMKELGPGQPCTNSIDVANIDDSIAAIEAAGGKCIKPKMPIPTIGWLAFCKDTEGNMFGVVQFDAQFDSSVT